MSVLSFEVEELFFLMAAYDGSEPFETWNRFEKRRWSREDAPRKLLNIATVLIMSDPDQDLFDLKESIKEEAVKCGIPYDSALVGDAITAAARGLYAKMGPGPTLNALRKMSESVDSRGRADCAHHARWRSAKTRPV